VQAAMTFAIWLKDFETKQFKGRLLELDVELLYSNALEERELAGGKKVEVALVGNEKWLTELDEILESEWEGSVPKLAYAR